VAPTLLIPSVTTSARLPNTKLSSIAPPKLPQQLLLQRTYKPTTSRSTVLTQRVTTPQSPSLSTHHGEQRSHNQIQTSTFSRPFSLNLSAPDLPIPLDLNNVPYTISLPTRSTDEPVDLRQLFPSSSPPPLPPLHQLTLPTSANLSPAIFSFYSSLSVPHGNTLSGNDISYAEFVESCIDEFAITTMHKEAEEFCSANIARYETEVSNLPNYSEILRTNKSIEQTLAIARLPLIQKGFNAETIKMYEDDESFPLLKDLASIGVVIDTTTTFKPLTMESTCRPITSKLPHTTHFHAFKLAAKNKAVILEIDSIPESELARLSFNSIHIIAKPDAPQGRLCIDPTNVSKGIESLNSDEAKALAIHRYGKVSNTPIEDIVYDWDERRKSLKMKWSEWHMMREDVETAYPQLRLSDASALLMAVMISATLIAIFLTGTFGWTGLPMAYDIVGDAMLRCIKKKALGVHHVYTDDFIGGGSLEMLLHDKPIVIDVIRKTFNKDAWSLVKSIGPTQYGEALGWLFTFREGKVRPRDRAIRKLTAAFYSFRIGQALPIKQWQSLASIANHYAKGTTCLEPFVSPLYKMTQKKGFGGLSHVVPSPQATLCIEVWRVALHLWWRNPSAFSVPLDKFVRMSYKFKELSIPSPIHFSISDASTPKLAAAIYEPGTNNLIAWTQYTLPFAYTETHKAILYQNNREYLGVLLILLLASVIRNPDDPDSFSLSWCTDSTTAKAWVDHNKSSSLASQSTAISITWVQLLHRIQIESTSWRPSVEMGDIDNLTRNKPTPSLLPSLYIDVQQPLDDSRIFHSCDFTKTFNCETARDLMININTRVNKFIADVLKHNQHRNTQSLLT
jgi:hypothetical protein